MFNEVPYFLNPDHIAVVTRGEAGERFPVSIGFGDSTPRLLHLPDNRLFRLRDHQQLSKTRSLGALRTPTSSMRPFGPPLGSSGLLLALRASSSSLMLLSSLLLLSSSSSSLSLSNLIHFELINVQFNPQKWIPGEILMIFLFLDLKLN